MVARACSWTWRRSRTKSFSVLAKRRWAWARTWAVKREAARAIGRWANMVVSGEWCFDGELGVGSSSVGGGRGGCVNRERELSGRDEARAPLFWPSSRRRLV